MLATTNKRGSRPTHRDRQDRPWERRPSEMASISESMGESAFSRWLVEIRLEKYAELFEELGYDDLRTIANMSDEELADMLSLLTTAVNFPTEHESALRKALGKLRGKDVVATAPSYNTFAADGDSSDNDSVRASLLDDGTSSTQCCNGCSVS